MDYLDKNEVNTSTLRNYSDNAVTGLTVVNGTTARDSYVVLPESTISSFSDSYINEMKKIMQDSRVSAIVNTYINSNK